MPTVFSHIVQTRLSKESENVATTALEFILGHSEAAQNGMMKLLRGLVPDMAPLRFRTQQTEDSSRPDMSGIDGEAKPHVFIENKFWAGLTKNQPAYYIDILAKQDHTTLLLVVVPHKREQAVWGELTRRLGEADISTEDLKLSAGVVFNVKTSSGPILALTSWDKLLSFLEVETTDDRAARSDLLQLRALCDQEDIDAFRPFSSEETSDQEIPSLILQLTSLVQEAMTQAFNEGALHRGRLTPQADSIRIGRYAYVFADAGWGLWFGLHFDLWKKYGRSPLWVLFSGTEWGRATEVRALIEPWAAQNKVITAHRENEFVVGINIPAGEEKDKVIRGIVDQLKEIGKVLSGLKPRTAGGSGAMGKPLEDLIQSEPVAP